MGRAPELSKYAAWRKFRLHGHDYLPGDRIRKEHLNMELVRKLTDWGRIVDMDDDLVDDRKQKSLRAR